MLKKILITIGVLFTVAFGRFCYLGYSSSSKLPIVGIKNGKLTPCPNKPNCVSSFGKEESYISAFKTTKSISELKEILLNIAGSKLVTENSHYLHITFSSQLFNFVDDFELMQEQDVFHIRSASRVGHSDMGKNKERIQEIKELIK